MDIRNTVFAVDRVNETYSEILSIVEKPMQLNADRYYGGNQKLFYGKTNSIQIFMEKRYDFFPTTISEEFDISPELGVVHLSINDTNGEKIKINSLVPNIDSEWTGE